MTQKTVRELLPQATDWLAGRGVRSPRLDAEHLLAHALGVSRLDLYLEHDRALETAELDRFRGLLRRRGEREPLAYLLGSWSFRGLDLACDARALVPRPETEQLVEHALTAIAAVEGPAVVDLGTGTGAIALAIASERPDAAVTAVDLSPDALALAGENAVRTGLAGRVEWLAGDLLAPVAGRSFDLIVCNPPYVARGDDLDPEVARFEPELAVYAAAGGREVIARLARDAPAHLTPAGVLALEVGDGQAAWVCDALRAAGLRDVHAELDLAGVERIVLAAAAG